MQNAGLPEDIRGQWIWKSDPTNDIESYSFFRREFTLNESPRSVELWITACTFYHVFINGRHFCHGPAPGVGNRCYVSYFDIGYCLEIGKNAIAVIAHNTVIPRASATKKKSGFWCQLNIDELPSVWTDDSWMVSSKECYLKNQPRVSPFAGFVESVDLRKYPHGWTELDFDVADWVRVEYMSPVSNGSVQFVPLSELEPVSEKLPVDILILRGNAVQDKMTTHVNIRRAVKHADGLFVAESYVQAGEDIKETSIRIFSDDPYYLFVNNQLVKRQGGKNVENWTDPTWSVPRCYQQDKLVEHNGKVSFKSGWNRVLLFQQISTNSAGTTFIFPDIKEGELKFVKQTTSFGLPGWNITGPLELPFSNVTGSISLAGLPQHTYYGLQPCDSAAHLLSYRFDLENTYDESVDAIELENGQYAIFQIENYERGFLELTVIGCSKDTIDIVYGDYLTTNALPPICSGIRKVFTLTLPDREANWLAVTPHGMEYVMVMVRHASGSVHIRNLGLRKTSLSMKDQNSFTCSDELMNQMWEYGVNTLNSTYDYMFLTSGENPEGQKLADSMIQGITSYFVYGTSRLSEKALREFSQAQFETGEIPAVAPSDLSVRYYDFTMLWPIWLHHHVYYTGDRDILKDLLPNLERVLSFFESISSPSTGLIEDKRQGDSAPYLIDYDKSLEKKGISTALNALYCCSLLKAEWLFSLIGEKDKANECNMRASRIAAKLRELSWVEDKGLFADCWYEGEVSSVCSMQTNVLALYAGIAEEEQSKRVLDNLLIDYAPYQEAIVDKENESPYFKFFLLDMAFTLGLRDWAVEYMRYYWGKMVQKGVTAWWDKFSPDIDFEPNKTGSSCQGYGVSPNFFLIREVAGIRLMDQQGSRLYFDPILTACEWVRVNLHTTQGNFTLEWGHQETGELKIIIDSDFPLEVVPQLDATVAANAVLHVSDEVTIMQA